MLLGAVSEPDLAGLPGPSSQFEAGFRRLLNSCNQQLQRDDEQRSKPKFHAVSAPAPGAAG
jgi:hypothetical protein